MLPNDPASWQLSSNGDHARLLRRFFCTACAQLTSFSNEEERSLGLDKKVPFLLEDKLKELGAKYKSVRACRMHVPACSPSDASSAVHKQAFVLLLST